MVDEKTKKPKCVYVCPAGLTEVANGCVVPIDRRVIDIDTGADDNKNGVPDCCERWLDDEADEEEDRKRHDKKKGRNDDDKEEDDDNTDTEDEDDDNTDTEDEDDDNTDTEDEEKDDDEKGDDDDGEVKKSKKDKQPKADKKDKKNKNKNKKNGGDKKNDPVVTSRKRGAAAATPLSFDRRRRLCPAGVKCPATPRCAAGETAVAQRSGRVRCVKDCCADASCPGFLVLFSLE
jgi:site-specific DNA-cytosine methylase